jgi:iron transport multicopper oxidase
VDGLYGALIIHDPNDPYAGEYTDEVVLLFGDWQHQLGFNLLATFFSPKNPTGVEPMPSSGRFLIFSLLCFYLF